MAKQGKRGKNLNLLLGKLREDIGSVSFAESKLDVREYIDTGDYGLNMLISGNPKFGGIPAGKVVVFGGESSSGKSLAVARIASNALVQLDYDRVFYCDSEGGALYDYFEDQGVDMEKVEEVPVTSVEEATISLGKIFKFIRTVRESDNSKKYLVILDSIGNLEANKFIEDVEKGKVKVDMGISAKLKNSLMRKAIAQTMITQTPLIATNHIYKDPAALFASKIQNQRGGLGSEYAAHCILQTGKSLVKDENNSDEGNSFYKANVLKFFTTKNRMIKPFYSAEMYLDFDDGIKKYYGLIDYAIRAKFIVPGLNQDGKQIQGKWRVPSFNEKKNFKREDLENNDEVWNTFMDEFSEKISKFFSYKKDDGGLEDLNIEEEEIENETE